MNKAGLAIALLVAIVVGGIFAVQPKFDIDIAALFYDPATKSFWAWDWAWTEDVRDAATSLISLLVAPAFLAIVGKLVLPRRRMLIGGRAAMFLIATLALGPGVLANGILKDHWARMRPEDVTQLGGKYRVHAMVGSARTVPGKLFIHRRRTVRRVLDAGARRARPAAMAGARVRRRVVLRRRDWRAPHRRWGAFFLRCRICRRLHVPAYLDDARPDLSLAGDALFRRGGRAPVERVSHALSPFPAARRAARASDATLASLLRPPIVRANFWGIAPGAGIRLMPKGDVKKVVLAYSGGLDTSIILKWLQTTYGCEVVTFTADLGQGEELEPARAKALMLGIKPQNIFIEDLREEFVRDYVFPMFRANALYEGQYLLGTSIARPLIAKKQIEIAEKVGADAVAHGATGKGNDQVRFELAYYALKPDVKVVAPWREWEFRSREALLAFAEQNQIPIAKDKRGEAPFSTDANLLHTSSEGKVLENPGDEVPDYVYSRTDDPSRRRIKPAMSPSISSTAIRSRSTASMSPATSARAAQCARPHARHRPARSGGEPLRRHEVARHVRDAGRHHPACRPSRHRIDHARSRRRPSQRRADAEIRRADLYGFWFSPEREMLQAAIDKSQEFVTGRVRLKLYKGNVGVVGRREQIFALRPGPGDVRGRQGRLRPARRRRLYPAQCAAATHARATQA